jgi:hypothetical protein
MNKAIKNLPYPDFLYLKNHFIHEIFKDKSSCLRKSGQILMYYLQKTRGIQLFVEKNVSDELRNTDIKDITYKDIIFPASSIEFYFEDKDIPTVLLSKKEDFNGLNPFKNEKLNVLNISATTGKYSIGYQPGIAMIYTPPFADNMTHHITASIDNFNEWISNMEGSNSIKNEANEEYNNYAKKLLFLMTKILLYISIPQYKSRPITKNQLQRAGKPGVKNRPNRPCFKVIYVPPIININKNESMSDGFGTKKKPHFRRGHFMMLRHERFKEQGKLVFVRPCMIHGGSIKDKLYVARKAEENTNENIKYI